MQVSRLLDGADLKSFVSIEASEHIRIGGILCRSKMQEDRKRYLFDKFLLENLTFCITTIFCACVRYEVCSLHDGSNR